ncbi:MAG TPA: hypothetical protein VES42_01530 [Pilimelia sp.]|nr:hypothetical protein [Pilimelia sp.]
MTQSGDDTRQWDTPEGQAEVLEVESPGTAADAEAGHSQVLGRGVEVDRAAAEAGPGDPLTGARTDADGHPVA